MLERRWMVVAVMGALAVAPACEKKSLGTDKPLPSELQPTKASFDISKLVAPALFAHIPADTPYVLGAFEPVGLDYYAKLKQGFGPLYTKMLAEQRALANDGPGLVDVILDELGGTLDAKSIEALGISAQPRFAVYGLGVLPLVVRLEIKDEAALRATVERVASRANLTLAPQEAKDGRAFWRLREAESSTIIAILDQQLVAAFGPTSAVDAKLDLILGIQKPAQSMADGKALLEVLQKHGFGPQLVGFIDTRKLGAQALAMAPAQLPAACAPAVDEVAAKVPRIAMGYTEVSGKRMSGGAVVELDAGLLGEVAALRTEVPGLGAALSGDPLIAMGGGLDFVKGAGLLARAATALRAAAEACQYGPGLDAAAELADMVAQPPPAPTKTIAGFAAALHSFDMAGPGLELDAFAMLTGTSGKELYQALEAELPIGQVGLGTDGKLTKLAIPGGFLSQDVVGAVGDKAIVFGTGAKGRALAEQGLRGSPAGPSPFLVMSYDYGRFFQLQADMATRAGGDPDEAAMVKSMADVLGRASFSVDVNDVGVVMWGAFELK